MARLKAAVSQAGISTSTAARTLLQIVAPANQRVALGEIGISFRGTSNTDPPVLVEVLRQTTAGTMSAATPVKRDASADETLQATAQHTATAEPTAGDVLKRFSIHPQSGLIHQPAPGEEVLVPGGGRVGVRVTTTTAQTADVYLEYEE